VTQMSPLRRRMIEDMTVRNLSPATQRSYISAVSKLSRYFGRSPEKLELEDVLPRHADRLQLLSQSSLSKVSGAGAGGAIAEFW
jgi:Phage integrase, N-terminal SAM-like domain